MFGEKRKVDSFAVPGCTEWIWLAWPNQKIRVVFQSSPPARRYVLRPRRVEGRLSGFRDADFAGILRDSNRFAFSSSARREACSPFPARLMKYLNMRKPDCGPFGETFLEASVLAI